MARTMRELARPMDYDMFQTHPRRTLKLEMVEIPYTFGHPPHELRRRAPLKVTEDCGVLHGSPRHSTRRATLLCHPDHVDVLRVWRSALLLECPIEVRDVFSAQVAVDWMLEEEGLRPGIKDDQLIDRLRRSPWADTPCWTPWRSVIPDFE